jgi:integrase
MSMQEAAERGRAKTMVPVEPGIFRRVSWRTRAVIPWLWVHYPGRDGKTEREPVTPRTTDVRKARRFRADRMAAIGRGEPGRAAERIKVGQLLDGYLTDAEVNHRRSLVTMRGHVKALRPAFGHLRAVDCTTPRVQAVQKTWLDQGVTPATINRRTALLRRAFVLGQRGGLLHVVPYIPRLKEQSPLGRYITTGDRDAIATALAAQHPDYARAFLFSYAYGIRKGQVARTPRKAVDLERAVIAWAPEDPKNGEPHVLPLDPEGQALVMDLLADPRSWCAYLFHGPDCAPGRAPSKRYACLGDFKKAFRVACKRAGVLYGRKAAGITYHCTRNTGATNLRAGGIDEADAMKVLGHKTPSIFRRYNLGDTETLRDRLARATAWVRSLPTRRPVVPLRGSALPSVAS